jgi:hypothetical protein
LSKKLGIALNDKDLIERYYRAIADAAVQKKYQMDIYVGDATGAPPHNEAHFILKEDGFWNITDWSRGQLQRGAQFLLLSDVLNFSFCDLTDVKEFRKAARETGYNPPKYDFDDLVKALSIGFNEIEVGFSVETNCKEMIAARGGKSLKLKYLEETRLADVTVYKQDCWNSKFDNLSDAMSHMYWNFSLARFSTLVF